MTRGATAALGVVLVCLAGAAVATTPASAQELTLEAVARAMMRGEEPTPEQLQELIRLGELLNGPAIEGRGYTVPAADPDVPLPTDHHYKVYFEVKQPSPTSELVGGGADVLIDSAARFLNMHLAAGVPRENLDLAVIIFGLATEAALGNEEYRARHGTDNPNVATMEALAAAGVDIYVCSQSAPLFGVTKENKAAPVKMVLSAMTMQALLQADGYVKVH